MRRDFDLDGAVLRFVLSNFDRSTSTDENNKGNNGRAYKAPDHDLVDMPVLIERKTVNKIDDGSLFAWVRARLREEGVEVGGVGTVSLSSMLRHSKDGFGLRQRVSDYIFNRIKKTIFQADKQFEGYARNTGDYAKCRLLVICDNSDYQQSTGVVEYSIGRLMLRARAGGCRGRNIDSIVYMANPNFVIDDEGSYWFKSLVSLDLSADKCEMMQYLNNALHGYVLSEIQKLHDVRFTRCGPRNVLV